MTLLDEIKPRRAPDLRQLVPASGPGRLGLGLAAGAAAATIVGARLTNSDKVAGYGLIDALPPLYWLGVVLATVATFLLLRAVVGGDRRLGPVVAGLWLVVLHLAPQLAHAHPRFSIVYVHLGFIRLIDTTHTGNILLDARFAWPGFFGAFISSLPSMSPPVLETVMRLWPAMITGAWTSLVAVLAHRSYPTKPLIAPVSGLVFVLLSWTGQDYFSPQSVGFFFYLSIIVIVECGPLRARGSWSSVAPILSRFATAGGDRPEARATPSYVALLVLSFGAVVSHPLAPFFICTGLMMLGLYGRRVAWRLLLLVGLGYFVWFAIAAQPYWIGAIKPMLAELGNLSNVGRPPPERGGQAPAATHTFVVTVRSAIGLSVFLGTLIMGVVMATNRFRHLRPALPLAPLAGIPVVAAGIQNYGGEMILRVFMFTLPMASILFARVLLSVPRRALPLGLSALALAFTPPFLVARFGNEVFEMVTDADWQAVQVLYDNADEHTLAVSDDSFQPWGYQDRERIEHRYSEAQAASSWLRGLRAESDLKVHTGAYKEFEEYRVDASKILVLFTPSQSAWLEQVGGFPPRSLDTVGQWLSIQEGVTVLFHDDHGAWVLEIEP
jgi:hypothetical protein